MINHIEQLDKELFLCLNGLHHPILDQVMYLFSERAFWIPLYLLLLILIVKQSGWKFLLVILPVTALVIAFTDQLSVHLFKEVFKRYRPCHNEEIKNMIHLVKGCGGLYGFVSSHAANSFALAVLIGNCLKSKWGNGVYFMIIWALLVSYSRIYNGVHYPADIIAGGLLGIFAGVGGYKLTLWISKQLKISHAC